MCCKKNLILVPVVGSVLDIIKHQKSKGVVNGIFDEAIVASILFEALKGLDYFHSQGQMHRSVCFECVRMLATSLLCESYHLSWFGLFSECHVISCCV